MMSVHRARIGIRLGVTVAMTTSTMAALPAGRFGGGPFKPSFGLSGVVAEPLPSVSLEVLPMTKESWSAGKWLKYAHYAH